MVVIEHGRRPCRCVVANETVSAELVHQVIGFNNRIVVGVMTCKAVRGCPLKSGLMTGNAIQTRMTLIEVKAWWVLIVCLLPVVCGDRMANFAGAIKPCQDMAGAACVGEIGCVASLAGVGREAKLQSSLLAMAGFAVQACMFT